MAGRCELEGLSGVSRVGIEVLPSGVVLHAAGPQVVAWAPVSDRRSVVANGHEHAVVALSIMLGGRRLVTAERTWNGRLRLSLFDISDADPSRWVRLLRSAADDLDPAKGAASLPSLSTSATVSIAVCEADPSLVVVTEAVSNSAARRACPEDLELDGVRDEVARTDSDEAAGAAAGLIDGLDAGGLPNNGGWLHLFRTGREKFSHLDTIDLGDGGAFEESTAAHGPRGSGDGADGDGDDDDETAASVSSLPRTYHPCVVWLPGSCEFVTAHCATLSFWKVGSVPGTSQVVSDV